MLAVNTLPPLGHHSPSSGKTWTLCERKWWYEYRERRREPDVAWAAIVAGATVTPGQRARARGAETHARLEAYYLGAAAVDWSDEPGELALRMRAHLPAREECLEVSVERSVGTDPYPADEDPVRTRLHVDGVPWLGYVDLAAYVTHAEARRLFGSRATAAGWYTFDYKTSADVGRYAITPEEALTGADGGQGLLYAYDALERTCTNTHVMRWVYAQTRGARIARPVDVVFEREPTRRRLAVLSAEARNREARASVEECVPNPEACFAYGGCPHHHSRGGPCNAVREIGDIIMGWADKYKKTEGATAPATDANAPADQGPAPTEAPAETPPTGANGPAETPPATKARAPRTAKAAPTGFAALAQALAESEAELAAASAKLEAAKEAMRRALA